MKSLSKNPFFYLSLVLALAVGFQIYSIVAAQEYSAPTKPPTGGMPARPLNEGDALQVKKGALEVGSGAQKVVLTSGGQVVFKDSGGVAKGGIRFANDTMEFSEDVLASSPQWKAFGTGTGGTGGGVGWSRTGTNVYLTTSTDSVGIGTNIPQGILDVQGDNNIELKSGSRSGSVNIGSGGGLVPFNVYGNTSIFSVPLESSTGYLYDQLGGAIISLSDPKYNVSANINFDWWKEAFSSEFGSYSAGATGWAEAKITNARTDNDCEDTTMLTTQCLANSYKALSSAPTYVYDLSRFKEEGAPNYSISYRKFLKRVSGYGGGNLTVAGQIKIAGGSPGAGKVLTSDADGLATWQVGGGGPPSIWDGEKWVDNGRTMACVKELTTRLTGRAEAKVENGVVMVRMCSRAGAYSDLLLAINCDYTDTWNQHFRTNWSPWHSAYKHAAVSFYVTFGPNMHLDVAGAPTYEQKSSLNFLVSVYNSGLSFYCFNKF